MFGIGNNDNNQHDDQAQDQPAPAVDSTVSDAPQDDVHGMQLPAPADEPQATMTEPQSVAPTVDPPEPDEPADEPDDHPGHSDHADEDNDEPAGLLPPESEDQHDDPTPSVAAAPDEPDDTPASVPPLSDHAGSSYMVDDDNGHSTPVTPTASVSDDDLLDMKQKALGQLSPLVSHLDQTPSEKFRTTMMMIQGTDDKSLIKTAYEAAQAIDDEKERAQALLDIVNEINYFTQQPDHED